MIGFLLSLTPKGWITIAVAFALGAGSGTGATWWLRDQMAAKAALARSQAATAAANRTIARVDAADHLSGEIGGRAERALVEIRTVTRTITEQVPVYVTPEIDRTYPLPLGFVRVLDAATLGVPPSAVSRAPGEPDDAPSTVPASAVGTVLAGDLGSCREDAAKYAALQEWVRAQQALWAKP